MRLIVGLGNPGHTYDNTRHNVGFRVVEELAGRLGVSFRRSGRAPFQEASGLFESETICLLKPLTYMNRSGNAIRAWLQINRIDAGSLTADSDEVPIVVCDDLALPLGSLRLRPRGSAGGQKGLESIIKALPGLDLPRLRLGVAGGDGVIPPDEWSDYVLSPFSRDEAKQMDELVAQAADALQHLLRHGLEEAASRFNRRVRPSV